MNNPEFHDSQAAADFDARCKALLEHRTVDAPAPREGLFNNAGRSGAWRNRAAWGAAALFIAATVAMWPDSHDNEVVSAPEPAMETAPASQVPSEDVTKAMATAAPEVATTSSVVVEEATETPAEAVQTEEIELPATASGDAPKAESEVAADVDGVEGTTEKATDIEAVGNADAGVEPLISEGAPAPEQLEVNEPSGTTEESAIQEENQPKEAEEAEGAPTLKLPLQLKSGGGQQ